MLKLDVVYWKLTDYQIYCFTLKEGLISLHIFLKYVLERSSAECALTIKWSPHEYSLQSALNLTVIKKVRYIHILAYSMCANGQSQLYICITVPSVVDFSQVMSGVSRTRMILISVSSSLNM